MSLNRYTTITVWSHRKMLQINHILYDVYLLTIIFTSIVILVLFRLGLSKVKSSQTYSSQIAMRKTTLIITKHSRGVNVLRRKCLLLL